MPVPWFHALDLLISVIDLTRGGRSRAAAATQEAAGRNEAPDRDAWQMERERMDLERERMAVERQRAERALKLELLRQAGDREIGRLRLTAGIAVTGLIGSLLFWAQLVAAAFTAIGTRLLLGSAWLLLVGALAFSFIGQARIAAALAGMDDTSTACGITP